MAERVSTALGRASAVSSSGAVAVVAGASSRMTEAIVPVTPKPFTMARPVPVPGQERSSVGTVTGASSQAMRGEGVTRFRWGKTVRSRSWSAALMSEPTPAAPSMWPMFVFSDPTTTGRALVCESANTSLMASISVGSPSAVPVPWASTYWMSPGSRRQRARAERMTCSWAAPLGATRPALSPSWPTAEPRIRAWTVSPSRRASDSRLRTRTPQPSARA